MAENPVDIEDIEAYGSKSDGCQHDEQVEGNKSVQAHVETGTLQRRLKSRNIQFLALSGAIGMGLFVRTGQDLTLAGPLSTVLAYLITGFNLYAVINSVGEMATW